MRPINVVLAYHDAISAECLAASLHNQFRSLVVAKSRDEVGSAISRLHAEFVVADLELIDMSEVKQICAQFPSAAVVCVHRLADDRMWSEALSMGAVDCCRSNDMRGILLASERYVVLGRGRSTTA